MNPTAVSRKNRMARLAALLIWVGILLWLSLSPNPPQPSLALLSWDKLQHAGAYAVLTFLAGLCFSQWRPLRRHCWLNAWLFAIVFGGLVELLQGALTDVRWAEWGDLAANSIGGMLVSVAATLHEYRLRGNSAAS